MTYFKDIFDAQEVLQNKKLMFADRITHEWIKPRDIVVVEASIVRWQKTDKDEPKATRFPRGEWDQWRAEFRLETLFYIFEGSKHPGIGPSGVADGVHL